MDTNRNTRRSAAAGAGEATDEVVGVTTTTGPVGAVADEVKAADGAAVVAQGTSAAAVAAAEALAAGGAGAGAGANRIVEAVGGPAVRDVPIAGIDRPGERLATDDRRTGNTADIVDRASAAASVATRPGRDAILPLAEPKLDPRLVPGRKVATAATQVRRGARSYAPGETFAIDFRAHSELVPIGAIVSVPWHDLPDA